MSGGPAWQASLSSSARYDNIQTIKTALEAADPTSASSSQDAFSLENEAYKTSVSLGEYNTRCQTLSLAVAKPSGAVETTPTLQEDGTSTLPGETIGPYTNCQYVASGVTAEVYRSQARALKVIVETRNLEPHNPAREAKILRTLTKPCIPLIETFRDQEQRFVLVFPYMPLSLEALLAKGALTKTQIRSHFADIFNGLDQIHKHGIIHRDVKPSAVLLESADGPAYLSDFGTAWHPEMSSSTEPASQKILDIGTGPYRAPEVLFGDKAYGTAVDMWGAGTMLVECCRDPPSPLFESRAVHEDGNQLGLILSIFKTIGSPTRETWPEAASFRTPPFEMYQSFEGKSWDDILLGVDPEFHGLIAALVKYQTGSRATAVQALDYPCIQKQSK